MIYNQQTQGIIKSIKTLIPNININVTITNLDQILKEKNVFFSSGISSKVYAKYDNDTFIFWIKIKNDSFYRIQLDRDVIKLTKKEMALLGRIPDGLGGIDIIESRKNLILSQNIASYLSFEQLLISKYLRGGHASSFWVPTFVLIQLEELTFKKYEGKMCTSGFLFTSEIDLYKEELLKLDNYHYISFKKVIKISEDFFENPASHKYVDGIDSFYLINNHGNIYGVISIKEPSRYTTYQRSMQLHIKDLAEKMPGAMVCYIGRNNEVNIYKGYNQILRWHKNHWQYRNIDILIEILELFRCENSFIFSLTSIILHLSDSKMGSLILLPEDENNKPITSSLIDNSEIGDELINTVLNRNFIELVNMNLAIGMLTADGLTTINRNGVVINCGEIIKLDCDFDISHLLDKPVASTELNSRAQDYWIKKGSKLKKDGGSRGQAAISASKYGLAINISEDGPISLYYKGLEIITM